MASTRKARPNNWVDRTVADLAARIGRDAKVCVALSGGMDSVVLLDIVSRHAKPLGCTVGALHVHHGISAYADDWAQFCSSICRRRGIRLRIERVSIEPWHDQGVEAAARIARYRAFAAADADVLLLAHHRNDQAETVLLQLLRGAGLAGLAAMSEERSDWRAAFASAVPETPSEAGTAVRGVARASPPKIASRIVRPLLAVERREIAAYARRQRLSWIEDDSNTDVRLARNFLRTEVMPLLERIQPAAVANLARSARHLAAGHRLLVELGRADVRALSLEAKPHPALHVANLLALGADRGHNALRVWLTDAGVPPPSTAQLEDLWRQLAARTARLQLHLGGWQVERYRDRLCVERSFVPKPPPGDPSVAIWHGEKPWVITALGGTIAMRGTRGQGIARRLFRPDGSVDVRVRHGGERLRLVAGGPSRTIKNVLQEMALPAAARSLWPLVYVADRLAWVPGAGYAAELRAGAGESGLALSWHPDQHSTLIDTVLRTS